MCTEMLNNMALFGKMKPNKKTPFSGGLSSVTGAGLETARPNWKMG
jgi:hypothetical protein